MRPGRSSPLLWPRGSSTRCTQTPQVFRRAALERALDVADDVLAAATDDAWLVERGGGKIVLVRSSEQNIKVTTPLDLQLAELLAAELSPGAS